MTRPLPLLGVALFAAVFFAPELVGGRLAATANMARWQPWASEATEEERRAPSHNPDCLLSYYPRRAVLHQAWREGHLPLWNPYSFCGTAFLADVQAGVFYPPNWLLLPLDPGKQLGWFLFLHVAWGGIGAFVLTRGRGLPRAVAAVAGCAFALNGFFAKQFGHPTFLATAAWIPWVVHLALEVSRRPGLRGTARLGLAGAMTFLAGQPQIAILGAYATGIVVAGDRLAARGRASASGSLPRVGLALAGAGVLAFLLAGAQFLPTWSVARLSARAVLPYSTVLSGAFHPVEGIRLLVPELFGTPITGDEWSALFPRGDGFYLRNQANSIFAGTPVFLLALWGMASPRTRRAALPFTALFTVSVLIAFGSPLARAAYDLLPGFRFARLDRAGGLVVLAQIVPAALASADLARVGGFRRRVFGGAVILLAAGAALGVILAGGSLPVVLGADASLLPGGELDPTRAARVVSRTLTAAAFAGAAGGVMLLAPFRLASVLPFALAAGQLFLFAAPYRGDRRPEDVFAPAPDIERLRAVLDGGGPGGGRFVRFGRDRTGTRAYPLSNVLPPSTNVPYRLRDLQGYNALADRRLGETLETALGENVFSHGIWAGRRIVAPTAAASLEHPLLDALSVRAAATDRPLEAAGWSLDSVGGISIWRNDEALPRVRIAPGGRGVSAEEMEEILRTRAFDPRREELWVGRGAVGTAGGDGTEGSSRIEELEESWNEIVIRAHTDGERLLVVADSFGPGWEATLDGDRVDILPVYGVLRGVVLPPGDHAVRMRYRPDRMRRGIVLSLLGMLFAGFALAAPPRAAPR